MNQTQNNNTNFPSGSILPDDYTTSPNDQWNKSWNVPIILPENKYTISYFLEIVDCSDGANYYVHECASFISVNVKKFDTLQKAIAFMRDKGVI